MADSTVFSNLVLVAVFRPYFVSGLRLALIHIKRSRLQQQSSFGGGDIGSKVKYESRV